MLSQHEKVVREAVEQGKPVPANVLEEFKDEPWAKEVSEVSAEKSEPPREPTETIEIKPPAAKHKFPPKKQLETDVQLRELRLKGEAYSRRLEEAGLTTDADNIKRAVEKFAKAEDITMLESTVETAQAILKTKKPSEAKAEGPKISLKEHKEQLLARLDEAIKNAPTTDKEIPEGEQWLELEIGGTKYRFLNRKVELQKARKSVNAMKVTQGKPRSYRTPMPKPSAHKKESVGGLYPIEGQKGWWTDGTLLVKGKPPKGAKPVDDADRRKLTWDFVKEKTFGKPGKKAEFKYYATETGEILDVGVGKEPMPRLAEGRKDVTTFAVFKVGEKYYPFDQDKFNVVRNRYPNATYRMNKDETVLIVYDGGEPVAALGTIRGREESIPGYEMAKEAGYANIGKYTTGYAYANVGQYATHIKQILKLPEIVRLAKELLGGRYPKVREKLSKRMATGFFRPKGKGDIFLRADIFRDPEQAAAVLAHEIGHLVDWLPDHMLKRGNILGRIASLKRFTKHTLPRGPGIPEALTEADRRRLRYLAKKLVEEENADKWIDEVITKELPITPDDVLGIWHAVEQAKLINPELHDYIATLSTAEKKAIVKEALKGQIPSELQRFAKVVTEKTGRRLKAEVTPGMIHRKYLELLNEEIRKHRAFTRDEITNELKVLTKAWKPFDPSEDPVYTAYRYKSEELYADAFSALINAPGFLKSTAPKFYEAFFNYLEEKPQVKRIYDQIQDDIASGEAEKIRVKNLFDMFRKGDKAYAESLKKDKRFWDQLAREFIDANWFILKKVKKIGERNIPAGDNPRYKLEQLAYSGSEAELYLTTVFRTVVKPLERANISWDEFGEYLYHRRVSTERSEMANPQGWTPDLSKKRIEEIKENLSPEQWGTLEEARKAFRSLREDNIISKAEDAGIYSDETIKLFKDTENYATFDVIAYITKRYGRGPGGKIYRQIGTLNEISNPATATIMKDITLIKSINRQIAARSVAEFLRKNYPRQIREAERQWNGRIHAIKDPPEREGLLIYLDKGKAHGWYVDKDIAEVFNRNPVEGNIIARILSRTVQPFRLAFTELNYGFWMFNIHRDYLRASQMLPRAKITNFLPYYLKSIKPAFKSVYGIPDSVIEEMQRNNMLISIADVRGLRPEDKQIDRLLKMYHLSPSKWEKNILKPFGKLFNYYTNIGRGFERTTKVAAYQYLRKKFPDMTTEEIGHLVRVRGGSPDFLRLGRAYPIYNNLLLFSNAAKEGYRGDYEAFSDSPAEFAWKKTKYVLIPKLLMYAASLGLLGAGVKRIMDGASEYDKTNYIIIPLGLSKTGKSVYLRVPLDETSRLMGGILWKMLSRDTEEMTTGLFDYMSGQAPTIHPGVEILIATVQYASGLNPYDNFRGRYVIPEQVFEAGGKRSHEAFVKWLANKSGATLVYRFQYDDVGRIKGELEDALSYPFVSNIVGRFVKVSDQGIKETLEELKFDIRQANTREILDAKDALNKWMRGEPLGKEDIQALLKKPDIIDRNLMVGFARKYGYVYMEEYLTAQSNEEKVAVLRKMFQDKALERKAKEKKPIGNPMQPPPPLPGGVLNYGRK